MCIVVYLVTCRPIDQHVEACTPYITPTSDKPVQRNHWGSSDLRKLRISSVEMTLYNQAIIKILYSASSRSLLRGATNHKNNNSNSSKY